MTGVCPSGERAWQVAANALRMFAALSLRRSDDISLVFGDESSITRVPFNGGFAQFERTLDKALTVIGIITVISTRCWNMRAVSRIARH